jgi:hypothetical protein
MFSETGEVKYSKEHAERKGGKQENERAEQAIRKVTNMRGGSRGIGDECTKSMNIIFIVRYENAPLGKERCFLLVLSTWN